MDKDSLIPERGAEPGKQPHGPGAREGSRTEEQRSVPAVAPLPPMDGHLGDRVPLTDLRASGSGRQACEPAQEAQTLARNGQSCLARTVGHGPLHDPVGRTPSPAPGLAGNLMARGLCAETVPHTRSCHVCPPPICVDKVLLTPSLSVLSVLSMAAEAPP